MDYVPSRCLLKQRLREIGKSQKWLADRVGMSVSQISDYANTRTIMSLGTAKTIAEAIDCPIDSLYEWKSILNKR